MDDGDIKSMYRDDNGPALLCYILMTLGSPRIECAKPLDLRHAKVTSAFIALGILSTRHGSLMRLLALYVWCGAML